MPFSFWDLNLCNCSCLTFPCTLPKTNLTATIYLVAGVPNVVTLVYGAPVWGSGESGFYPCQWTSGCVGYSRGLDDSIDGYLVFTIYGSSPTQTNYILATGPSCDGFTDDWALEYFSTGVQSGSLGLSGYTCGSSLLIAMHAAGGFPDINITL
jgi:hypothetical protein